MLDHTRKLWDKQNQHPDDRFRLFGAVGEVLTPGAVLYAGSYVDVAPSFVFDDVTYVDMDRRAKRFFDDDAGVREIIAAKRADAADVRFAFVHGDYAKLSLPARSFDLLISLYAGFISEHCTEFLRVGGHLLVNPSHGDAALASLDERYRLVAAVVSRGGGYTVRQEGLDAYLEPKNGVVVTREELFATNRGVAYTRPAFAYLFERVM